MNGQRRFLYVLLCIVALLQPAPVSKASPSGCPNEWNLPKNLFDASAEQKKELLTPDFSTVIKPGRDGEYSFDGVNWMRVKNGYLNLGALDAMQWEDPIFQRNSEVGVLLNFFSSRWDDVTLLSFGDLSWLKQDKIYLRSSIEISKQNCGPPATYYYQKEFAPPGLEISKFEDEAVKIKSGFQNYQSYDAFVQRYNDCISRWKGLNNSAESPKSLDACYFDQTPIRIEVNLVPDEPNCLEFLPGNSNRASSVGIKSRTKCNYTILGFTGDPAYVSMGKRGIQATGGQLTPHYNIRTGNLVSFGKISINSPGKIIKLTCYKGKLMKMVSGSKPKCPLGYKQK